MSNIEKSVASTLVYLLSDLSDRDLQKVIFEFAKQKWGKAGEDPLERLNYEYALMIASKEDDFDEEGNCLLRLKNF